MKKALLIFALCLMVFTSFGKKVIVMEVTRSGNGWQNFFNCYERVTTSLDHFDGGTAYVNLECLGAGYNFCRASRQIGEISSTAAEANILSNAAIVNAVNELIEQSEAKVNTKGVYSGFLSKKVAVGNRNTAPTLYFINATWNYNRRDPSSGNMVITIETDDSQLINSRQGN